MIVPTAQSFYLLHANGEAAELITSIFSVGSMSDITRVVVLSREFNNDIEPINELDASIETLKAGMSPTVSETIEFNPLYIPSKREALDEVLEGELKASALHFTGMKGNPFAIKSIEIAEHGEPLITAIVHYKQFELPACEDIISDQKTLRIQYWLILRTLTSCTTRC